MPYDQLLAEAYRHAIMLAVELEDWEGVELAVDSAWSDPYVRDVVGAGVIDDMQVPVVEDGTLWPACIVGGCMLFYLIVLAVRAFTG